MKVEIINASTGEFFIFKLNGKLKMTRTEKEMLEIIDIAEKDEYLGYMNPEMHDFIKYAEKACEPGKIKKQNERIKQQRFRSKRYSRTPKGKYIISLANSTRRKKFKTACEGLTWEDKKAIGEFYRRCPEGYEVDHIIPVSRGGKHVLSNLQYLTREGNRRKKNKLDLDCSRYVHNISKTENNPKN